METIESKSRQHHNERLSRAMRYIFEHLDEPISVSTLGDVAHISPFHFHRAFSAATGINVMRLVQLLRLRRASHQLVFNPARSITDIALEAAFANAESFSRAFRKQHGQSPSEFRRNPEWQAWQVSRSYSPIEESTPMNVEIVDFPDTLIAALEHCGPEHLSYETTKRFIDWRQSSGIGPKQGMTLGIHYSDPDNTAPEDYRLDIAVTVDAPIDDNPFGVVNKIIPGGRCARARHHGSRHFVSAAEYLYRTWLPESGEELRDYPVFFHYVNVGPDVKESEMITDVYLPIAG